jgi:hypothetical protein
MQLFILSIATTMLETGIQNIALLNRKTGTRFIKDPGTCRSNNL